MRVALLLTLAWLAGCSSESDAIVGTYSCSASLGAADGGPATPELCVEMTGGKAQDLEDNQRQCTAAHNTFARTACPHGGAVAGCRQTSSIGVISSWYYDRDISADDVRAICEGLAKLAPAGLKIEFVLP
ncbi:MAG: hypothetical protein WDO74_29425 [Pseudomonadota bacterium]